MQAVNSPWINGFGPGRNWSGHCDKMVIAIYKWNLNLEKVMVFLPRSLKNPELEINIQIGRLANDSLRLWDNSIDLVLEWPFGVSFD